MPAVSPHPDLGRIKGVPIQHFLGWWCSTRGSDALQHVGEELHECGFDSYVQLERPTLGILPSVWYPAQFVHRLLDTLLAEESEQRLNELARQAADHTMSTILNGIYHAVFSLLANPARYPKYAQRIWGMHYDSGELHFGPGGGSEHVCRFEGWRGHHPFICMLNVQSAHAIYAAMGCKDIEVQHLACVSRGDPHCICRTRWSDPR